MEDLITDYRLQVKELRSLIIVLQKSIQNDSQDVEISEIDDLLEIAINKINTLLKNIDDISDNYNMIKLGKSV